MEMNEEGMEELVDAHWQYVEGVLTHTGVGKNDVEMEEIEYHYRTAFEHGYKHGREDAVEEANEVLKTERLQIK